MYSIFILMVNLELINYGEQELLVQQINKNMHGYSIILVDVYNMDVTLKIQDMLIVRIFLAIGLVQQQMLVNQIMYIGYIGIILVRVIYIMINMVFAQL